MKIKFKRIPIFKCYLFFIKNPAEKQLKRDGNKTRHWPQFIRAGFTRVQSHTKYGPL